MAVQSNTWNWKHLAARLLLAPLVAGVAAGVAAGQSPAPKGQVKGAPPMASPTKPVGAKELLKRGRQALAEGKLDSAEEFCRKAEQSALAAKQSWGMFEDTPTSLRKEIVAATDRANKTQAADCLKKAKSLLALKAATDAERMKNLDQALIQAHNASTLMGPGSMWSLSEKPQSVIADIKGAQEALRKKTGIMPGTATTSTAAAKPAAGQIPPPQIPSTVANPAKADVLRIVAEGRMLLSQDRVQEAKAKADAARKLMEEKGLLSAFTPTDDSPDQLLKAARMKGSEMVKALLNDCDKQMQLGAYDKADAACTTAMNLSTGIGLYSQPISEKKQMVAKFLKPATPGVMTPAATVMAAAPMAPTIPTLPNAEPMKPVMTSFPAPKNVMIEQAAAEMKRGDLDMARTLAVRAFNTDPKVKAEAEAILRQIDVEVAAKRRTEAGAALTNAMAMYNARDFANAQAVMLKIDPTHLSPQMKLSMEAALADCQLKLNPVQLVGGTDEIKNGLNKLSNEVKAATAPPPAMTQAPPPVVGTAPPVVTPPPAASPPPPAASAVVNEQKAIADIEFGKLRAESINVMKAASAAWEKGDPNGCLQFLDEYTAKVKASKLAPIQQARLLEPIESRQQSYGRLKHTYEVTLKEASEKAAIQNKNVGERVAEAQKQEEIKKKFDEINSLHNQGKFAEAEALALQVRMLDADNATVNTMYEYCKLRRRVEDNKRFKAENEQFVLNGLNQAEVQGPSVDTLDPLRVNPERSLIAARRGVDGELRARSAKEAALEARLSSSFPLMKFENMPLAEALKQIREKAQVNITIDNPSLEEEKMSLDSIILNEELRDISLDNTLKIILEKARLVYIVENDVVKVTTEKRTKGRMKTKAYHVMDLVTPIPEYKLNDHHSLGAAIEAGRGRNPAIGNMQGIGTATPTLPGGTIAGAELVSGQNGGSGQLVNGNSLAGINAMMPQREQYAEKLKKLVTGLVRPQSWADNANGGGGTIAYYDIGAALVVNQTADVQGEVAQLLESLRRLQDLSVAVEIRVVSLSEAYFERIGVDFQANITTNNPSFERSLATGVFRPAPFLNSLNDVNGTTVGWSPATGFTQDLGVPIRPSSYNLTMPPFGGYQTALSPTLNGGLSLGLAFLNDIQVYMFLEAAAGNRRINIMQAPKITLFNGQTSTVFVGDLAYFATGLQVFSANGQFVYLPVNQAFPIGQSTNPNTGGGQGVSVTVQAIISADRRFVRLNLTPSLTALASATVPLYPITTFITPVFEGGSQGQPIPFTQFFQQPSFTEVSVQTTVAIPDGGTVLLGGLKTMAQGRNEFGPPVLSNIPYLNRLFKNVGVGSETRHVMLMVTPRIIINSEEEARQTQVSGEGNNNQ